MPSPGLPAFNHLFGWLMTEFRRTPGFVTHFRFVQVQDGQVLHLTQHNSSSTTKSEHSSSTFLNDEKRAAAVKLCFYTVFAGPSRLREKWPLCCVYISKSAECQELAHGQERWCLQAESFLRNRNIVARLNIQLATSCPPAESDDSAACAKNCSQNCKLWNSRTISYSARLCKIRILHPKHVMGLRQKTA